jgi:hypothetical protein
MTDDVPAVATAPHAPAGPEFGDEGSDRIGTAGMARQQRSPSGWAWLSASSCATAVWMHKSMLAP